MSSKSQQSLPELPDFDFIDGVEKLWKYDVGGYHPVMIGDLLHNRYQILDKLGYGGWSTTWLARDTRLGCNVAVKVGIPDTPPHELRVLRALSDNSQDCSEPVPGRIDPSEGRHMVPIPLDQFELQGPNGTHPCYTMAVAHGNLREASYARIFPLDVLRSLAAGLTLAVAYVHSRGYVHGDIHLRNVLRKGPPGFDRLSVEQLRRDYGDPETLPITRRDGQPLSISVPAEAVVSMPLTKNAKDFTLPDTQIILCDFGEAFSPATMTRPGKDCHTPIAFRPPEAFFEPEAPLSFASDIWSLGCALWDLLGMNGVFSSDFAGETTVIGQYVDVMGSMPQTWWKAWEHRHKYFHQDQTRISQKETGTWSSLDDAFERGVQEWRRELSRGEFDADERAAILELMKQVFVFRPENRPSAEEMLRSEWMSKWALREYRRAKLLWEDKQE